MEFATTPFGAGLLLPVGAKLGDAWRAGGSGAVGPEAAERALPAPLEGVVEDEALTEIDALTLRARLTEVLVASGVARPLALNLADEMVGRVVLGAGVARSWREALAAFFAAAFSPEELRAWVWGRADGPELLGYLGGTSPLENAVALISALERRSLVDREFFGHLARARPGRVDEILALRARWVRESPATQR